MFSAGAGCADCTSALFLGSGTGGLNLYAGSGGVFAHPHMRSMTVGRWLAIAMTVSSGGVLRMYTGGALGNGAFRAENIWESSGSTTIAASRQVA